MVQIVNSEPFAVIDPQFCAGGKNYVNKLKFAQKIFMLGNQSRPFTVDANGRGRTVLKPPADQGDQGDLEAWYLVANSTGAFSAELKAVALNRNLSNVPVESTLMFGNSTRFPGRLIQPLYLPAQTDLEVEVQDLSGSSNTIRLTLMGHQLLDPHAALGVTARELRRRAIHRAAESHPYWLSFDDGAQVTVGASSTATKNCTVPTSGDLNCWGLVGRATDPDNLTIEIFEGQRRALMDQALTFSDIVACTRTNANWEDGIMPAASVPFVFPFTHLFERGTTLQIKLTDTSGNANVVSLAFPGQLLYNKSAYPPRQPAAMAGYRGY